jgi:uncharacterized protein (DUF427 family)
MTIDRDALDQARSQWRWRGDVRPPFAVRPGPGQESVWDYPRPPVLQREAREVIVRWKGRVVARTRSALRWLETAHPPCVYLPPQDVDGSLLAPASGSSFCEWKGPARYWSLADGEDRLEHVAWSYPQPFDEARAIQDHLAFYAHGLECTVDGQRVTPQPGSFYGGWITAELVGPFKGGPGTQGW